MLDLILAGPGVTPDLVCDLADEFMAGEVLTRPNAARFCGLSPMTARSIARRLADDESIDVLEVKAGLSVWDFRVICLDMDGTVIQNECIDDMAALHGVGEEVSSVTRAAMEGGTKLTFAESLEKRVAFLRDAPVSVIDEALASVRLQPGAARLIDFCNAHGIRSYVLSGGFTHFTHAIATRLGMTGDFSNMLGIDAERGVLTGTVTGPAGGRILDADGKRRTLEILCHQAGATLEQAIAAGDGANDLEMIGAAALGIAYHARRARPSPPRRDGLGPRRHHAPLHRSLALTSRPSAAHPQDAGSPFSPVPRHPQRTALRVLSLVFTFSLESPAAGLLRLLLDRRFG